MASDALDSAELSQPIEKKIQIYSTPNRVVSPFWRDKYERDAKKYWDVFYKRHQDKFFKDRHYLDKEWGHYFSAAGRKVILEVGCGAGNTIFPLAARYSDIFIHACDFSPRAVNLVKAHKDFVETRVHAFVCDLTLDDLSKHITPSSVDIVTMIFVLSAVSPEKMHLVLQNIRKVLKPNGYVLFRDYATGDLAQERFTCKEQKISEDFYVRGDGTRAFYFSDEFLTSLFKENGFATEQYGLCCKKVENRAREIVMNRRWVQAVFLLDDGKCLLGTDTGTRSGVLTKDKAEPANLEAFTDSIAELEIDMSEGMAVEMFGISPCTDEIIKVEIGDWSFKIKLLSKEYQHTCKSTGLMLWESARLMASVLAANQNIVAGKRVLEVGCGCGGICSMVTTKSAHLVVATDGDDKALDLLTQNVASNLNSLSVGNLIVKSLLWGNKDHIEMIKQLNNGGFDIIIGTDVTYRSEAITPLFSTASELISSNGGDAAAEDLGGPALILCHVLRRVDEPSITTVASQFGFRLVDRWPSFGTTTACLSKSIISAWFSEKSFVEQSIPNTALSIMYFVRA